MYWYTIYVLYGKRHLLFLSAPVVPVPVAVLPVTMVRPVYIPAVEVVTVAISSPVDITTRSPVIVASIRIPADHEARVAADDQRYAGMAGRRWWIRPVLAPGAAAADYNHCCQQ